jgi:myo-inositol 2-dehydrogenase/D-chiro-inositol 1-dehydrogenase
MPFKIAVIGCGWISLDCHGPAYARYAASHPDVELTACCDLDAQSAAHFKERFCFLHCYNNYQEMLQIEKPDAVCLNVPPEVSCSIGCDILRAGYPLMIEKPPGLTIEEIDRLTAAAEGSGVTHQVAFNRRFMPLVQELKLQLVGQSVQHVDILMTRCHRLDPDFTTTAVHDVDLARFLLDSDFHDINFRYQVVETAAQSVTNYHLDGVLESGVTVRIGVYPATGMVAERVTVYDADQVFALGCSNGLDYPGWLRQYRENELVLEISGAQLAGSDETYVLNGFYAEDAAFFDAVRAGKQAPHDLRSARQSVEIMQAMCERKPHY